MVTSASKSLEMVIKMLINRISVVGREKISLCFLEKLIYKVTGYMSRTAYEGDFAGCGIISLT